MLTGPQQANTQSWNTSL